MAAKNKSARKSSRKNGSSEAASAPLGSQSAEASTRPAPSDPPIVGIAGSAGALTALTEFFDALPDAPGMAFVVITHLSPDHESHMGELLQSRTKMTVTQVSGRLPVQPNHVYVIPPSRNILISDSHVDVAEFLDQHAQRAPIDFFFRTLALSGHDAVAIILSGGGTDGSVGIKQVKEEGGLLMVQDPDEAEYASMPDAAIDTGLVDVVLPIREIAARLMEYGSRMPVLSSSPETVDDKQWDKVLAILSQVQRRTKHDFAHYKQSTVLRRISRRMLINDRPSLDLYLEFMRHNPPESFALLNDLLIGVTNFFRDHEAWDALARLVLPAIFKEKNPADTVRIWSVGCASGEEAYSLAILCLETLTSIAETRTVQIFASDIDDESLARAREGLYPVAIEADVSPERLSRFFLRQGDYYRVRRELRDMILFTPHSVLRDPPFSRQDLIVCRNLLIYLQRDIQEYALDVFHYALNPGGCLFLGSSESVTGKEAFFRTTDKAHRIFEAAPWPAQQLRAPAMPLIVRPTDRGKVSAFPRRNVPLLPGDVLVLEEAHRRSLETFGPPSILVNADYGVLNLSESAGRYLRQPKGPISTDLLKLVRPELQSELRLVLFHAFDNRRGAVSAPVLLDLDGHRRSVVLSAYPRKVAGSSDAAGEGGALVVFLEDEADVQPPATGSIASAPGEAEDGRTAQLQTEAQRLRDRLRLTMEEYESSSEEMKAANEELQSVNEEYHLTTEELETSKEELEAVNEELQIVNNELKAKLDEVSRVHKDLENVMAAMEIATLFLDRALRIQRFTPAVGEFFNILKTDIGRPIDHLATKLIAYPQLTQDAFGVLDGAQVADREVAREDGKWFLIRQRPYRTGPDHVDGVVITFVDITAARLAEAALRDLNQTLEQRVVERTGQLQQSNEYLAQSNTLFSTLFHVNPIPTSLTRLADGLVLDINDAYSDFFGLSRQQAVGHTSAELGLPFQGPQRAELVERLRRDGPLLAQEFELTLPSGDTRFVLASVQRIWVNATDAMLSTFIDITARVQAEQQVRSLASSLTSAEQRERHRISQVLHDDLQQRLFSVKMQIAFLQDAYQKNDQDRFRKELAHVDQWLDDAIKTTRRLSIDLSPVILNGENLADALSWLAGEMRERYGFETILDVRGPVPALDDDLRVLMFHTVRELLFNVVKHGEAQSASITLEDGDDSLRVIVKDSGKGFDAEQVMADSQHAHGLLELRNRLMLLGGTMEVRSTPGDGTEITIVAPLHGGARRS